MKTIPSFMYLGQVDFYSVANVVKAHEESVYLLSFFIAGFSSFIMWMAFRRIKSEKWMKYFAWTFGLLAGLHLMRMAVWFVDVHPNRPPTSSISEHLAILIVLQILSLANNLCAIAAARDLENKPTPLPRWCWLLALGSLTAMVAGYTLPLDPPASVFLARSLDALFSAYCLFLLGYAIFANLSSRRYWWVAFLSLVIASVYALTQLAYGLSPLIAERIVGGSAGESRVVLDSFLIALSLPMKLILCASAYLLVIRFFETLNELTNLQDSGIGGRQDYLSSEGVVKLIADKLVIAHGGKRKAHDGDRGASGFVNLTVKLPGEKHKRVACILSPCTNPDGRVEVLDWDGRTGFSRLRGYQHPERRGKSDWEKALRFVGVMLTNEMKKPLVWVNDRDPSDASEADAPQVRSIVNVAIETHGATIGCLQVARLSSPFSQMAIRQIHEIANLVSPAVQAYRELAALDQISIRFAEKQAEDKIYPPAQSCEVIADILYNVFASVILRLQVDFGFTTQEAVYKGDARVALNIKEKISWDDWDKVPTKFVDQDIISYQLLKKRLTARLRETVNANEPADADEDRFILGNLLIVVYESNDKYDHPALGTNYLHRRAASTLAADAFLDFARDFFGGLLKTLSKELSRRQLSVEEGFGIIKATTKSAGLSWVAVTQRERKGKLGDEAASDVLYSLDRHTAAKRAVVIGEIEIVHYRLASTQAGANHVLKLKLPNSERVLWLGVPRERFGPELDFASPWRTFLVSLAQISDAALSRIDFAEMIQKNQVESAQFQGFASALVTTGTIIHQLSNLVQGQSSSISTLLDALRVNTLRAEPDLRRIMFAMSGSAEKMQDLLNQFSSVIKTDERRPCQLLEAAQRAHKLFEVSLLQRRVDLVIDVPDDVWVDVPFNVAALALANLVGNAKDAVNGSGKIKIESDTVAGKFVLCRVIDNGRGVAPEMLDKLFHLGASDKEHGSGLGLYLTMRSLLENRSHIELTKTDERGSVFTIRFPVAKPDGTQLS